MRLWRRTVWAIFGAAWLLAACGPAEREARPPEIEYGLDICEACGMIISEARFAAATVMTDGQAHKFDDIGDMLAYHREHPEEEVRAWFVHDYNTEAWLRGETAFYVVSSDIASPMGHGLAAFESRAAADAFTAGREAQVVDFGELLGGQSAAAHGE